jgi:hypothetical protein
MDDLLRCAVLEEALNSKRGVRERLMRELRRACGGPIDAPRQTPIAGVAETAHTAAQEPLGAFLMGALQRGAASVERHASGRSATAVSCESPLAR